MRAIFICIILAVGSILIPSKGSSQAIRSTSSGLSIEKISANLYKSSITECTYRFDKDGSVWLGKPDGSTVKVTFSKLEKDGRTSFYDAITGEFAGCYYPTTKRFIDGKEAVLATITDNNTILSYNGEAMLTFEPSTPLKVLGQLVFFNY